MKVGKVAKSSKESTTLQAGLMGLLNTYHLGCVDNLAEPNKGSSKEQEEAHVTA